MPSRLADDAEMQALCGSLREVGRGVLMMTKAATTPVPWIEDLAARAGRPFVVAALLHSNVTPEATFEDLAHIGEACARGHRLYGAVACTPLKFEFTMHEPYVFEGLGSWAPAMSAHGDAARALVPRSCLPRCREGRAGAARPPLVHRRVGEDARGADGARRTTGASRTKSRGRSSPRRPASIRSTSCSI